jgi:type II secretory pathway component PulF
VVDSEETFPDPRLDALLRASGHAWPESDEALDSWLAGQELSREDESWLRDVVGRRMSQARDESVHEGNPVGTPVADPSGLAIGKGFAKEPLAKAAVDPSATTPPAPEPRTPKQTRPLSYADLALLNEQLLELVSSGVSLPGGLAAYASDLGAGRLEQVLAGLQRDLEAGQSLSEALKRQGTALPPLYRSLVAAGEAGGDLTTCLSLLHEQAEVDSDLDRRVRESLAYPAITFSAAVFGVVAVVAWIAPEFEEIFQSMGVTLPALTQAVLASAGWINGSPIAASLLGVGVIFAAAQLVPKVVPNLVRVVAGGAPGRPLGELSRSLSGFLARDLPLPAALEALREADLRLPDGTLERVLERVRSGATLADSLRPESVFPPTYVWLVGAAEARGDLPAALHSLARRHERAYRGRLKIVEAVVGPVALGAIGLIVGITVLSIFLPIFELQRALQQ